MEKIEKLEQRIDSLLSLVVGMNKTMIASFETVDSNMTIIESKIDLLVKEDLVEVKDGIANIQQELGKIEKVSRYSAEYTNLLKVIK